MRLPSGRRSPVGNLVNEESRRRDDLNAAAFSPQRDDVFARIAGRYDFLCDVFSLGLHRRWKQRVAKRIVEERWDRMLDAAAGTGHIVRRVLQRSPGIGAARHIIVSDICPAMLSIAAQRAARYRAQLDVRLLDAHAMPSIASGSIDLYSISLGLKICDRDRVLREAYRVLRPGGRLITLEASEIVIPSLHRLYLVYMNFCMPLIGRLATGGDASAYNYLLRGIRGFPNAEGLAAEMRAMGFDDVTFERMSLGIVAIHLAKKPANAAETGVGV